MMISASCPGKIILFGEHAVIYDKLGIASAIDKRVFTAVKEGKKGIKITNSSYPAFELSKESVFETLGKFKEFRERQDLESIRRLDFKDAFSVVIGEVLEKCGYRDLDIRIERENLKNIGHSAAIFASIVLAVSKYLGTDFSKKEISDIAYLGEVIAHGGIPSGIDNNTVTYGGFLSYKKSEGIKPLKINFGMPMIIVDSGEDSNTKETVSYVAKLKEEKPDFVDPILAKLNEISIVALDALKEQNLQKIGNLMIEYYKDLRKLNISTNKLDKIIQIASENGCWAKPTGGWGGGLCITLAENQKKIENLIEIYKKNNFRCHLTKLGVEGVRIESQI